MGRTRALKRRVAAENRCLTILTLGLMIALQVSVSGQAEKRPPMNAQRVTGAFGMYAEVFAAPSPDGRWLAFEYNDLNDPGLPHVAIMRLVPGSHAWCPILKRKPGRHLYVGDFSWSPDSRWLALMTNYPGAKDPWSLSNVQIAKINVHTGKVVRLTNFPPGTLLGPTTAWLRSGSIVFTGPDGNIYGVSANGGDPGKLIDVPEDKCGGVTNTLAVSPDQQSIIFEKDSGDDSQTAECNALWIGNLRTKSLRRLPTTGLRPLNPFWLDDNTVLFAGIEIDGGKWSPTGIYSVSLRTGEVSPVLRGFYDSPFVSDGGKTLYFSWGPTFNDYSGFHIWKMPLPWRVPPAQP